MNHDEGEAIETYVPGVPMRYQGGRCCDRVVVTTLWSALGWAGRRNGAETRRARTSVWTSGGDEATRSKNTNIHGCCNLYVVTCMLYV